MKNKFGELQSGVVNDETRSGDFDCEKSFDAASIEWFARFYDARLPNFKLELNAKLSEIFSAKKAGIKNTGFNFI